MKQWRLFWCGLVGVLAISAVGAQGAPQGGVRGVIEDADFNRPLSGVRVTIVQTGQTTTSQEQGNYVINEVKPGTYTVVFFREGYAREVRNDVLVPSGDFATVNTSLSGEFTDMDEFEVQEVEIGGGTEAGLLELRAKSPALIDSVSSELISQAGASDAASALQLVAGATVQDGKFAVIRGLPDRFVVSQINGVRLPSADKETRAAELDQFPSAVIESVQVSKTFTPDQQGDASGGAVNVVLKGIPDENVFEIKFGVSLNTNVAENYDDFITYKGGGVNFLGERDKTITTDPNEFEAAGVTFDSTSPVTYSAGLTLGGRHEFDNGVTVGAVASLFYKTDNAFFDDGVDDALHVTSFIGRPVIKVSGDDGSRTTELFDVTQGSESVKWGGLAAAGVETENHSLNIIYLFTHAAKDQATLAEDTRGRELVSPPPDGGADLPFIRLHTLTYSERETETLQFRGEHTLPLPDVGVADFLVFKAPQVDWTYALSSARFDEPDKRTFGSQYQFGFDPTFFPPRFFPFRPGSSFVFGNFQRTYESISEDSDQVFANVTFPFEQWSGDEGFVRVGMFKDEVERQFRQESFSNFGVMALPFPDLPPPLGSGPPGPVPFEGVFFSDGFAQWLEDTGQSVQESTVDVDYMGAQELAAWYVMVDLPVTSWLKFIGGVRFESTSISTVLDPEEDASIVDPISGVRRPMRDPFTGVRLISPTTGLPVGDSKFSQDDVLPAIAFVLEPTDRITIRGSYAETVARQTFRELTPVQQQEFLGGDVFIGNPGLLMAAVKNYDLRLDFTPYDGGLISLSWFRKDIKDPIEFVQESTADGTFDFTTPRNFPSAKMTGVEVEVRQDMGHFWEKLEGLRVGGNATFIDGKVQLPATETIIAEGTTERDMTNAPEFLLNFFMTYDIEYTGTKIGVFYTVRGDTLIAGALAPQNSTFPFTPSIYEEQFDSLNVTVSQQIGEYFNLKFSAKNLTNPKIREVYRSPLFSRDFVRSSHTEGIDLSLSLSAEIPF